HATTAAARSEASCSRSLSFSLASMRAAKASEYTSTPWARSTAGSTLSLITVKRSMPAKLNGESSLPAPAPKRKYTSATISWAFFSRYTTRGGSTAGTAEEDAAGAAAAAEADADEEAAESAAGAFSAVGSLAALVVVAVGAVCLRGGKMYASCNPVKWRT